MSLYELPTPNPTPNPAPKPARHWGLDKSYEFQRARSLATSLNTYELVVR